MSVLEIRRHAERVNRGDDQSALSVAGRVGDRDRVLAVSHGGIVDLPAIVIAARLGAKLDGASFGYGEGVRVTYAKNAPVKIEELRVR